MTDKLKDLLELEKRANGTQSTLQYVGTALEALAEIGPVVELLIKAEEALKEIENRTWSQSTGFKEVEDALASIEAFRKGEVR